MEFTGRLTADAMVKKVKGDKEVVNFSIAINERYRPKGSTETKEFVTFINVAWWMGSGIAKILRKGAIVTVVGRLYVNTYNDLQGNAKASINCNASSINLVHTKKDYPNQEPSTAVTTEPVEDLPF